MQWSDDAIVLATRPLGEISTVASLLTRAHGRHGGLVRGGRGRRLAGVLQPGNRVAVIWRGRLAEHLGTFTVELMAADGAVLLDDPERLAALASACALVEAGVPERQPHPPLFDAMQVLLTTLGRGDPAWPEVYVRWELGLLAELGFGLDLDACAATGATVGLTHVSPKSARAVSAAAAAPLADRLLRLPAFLAGGRGGPPANEAAADLRAGLALTGHFLERHVFPGGEHPMPPARARLVDRLTRNPTRSGVKAGP